MEVELGPRGTRPSGPRAISIVLTKADPIDMAQVLSQRGDSDRKKVGGLNLASEGI